MIISSRMRALVAGLAALGLAAPAMAAPGDRDTTFNSPQGIDYHEQLPYLGTARVKLHHVVVDGANRAISGGTWENSGPSTDTYGTILRYLPDGTHDGSFGNGIVGETQAKSYDGNTSLSEAALFLDPADRLRGVFLGNSSVVVARYQDSGVLDDDFGDHGVATFSFDGSEGENVEAAAGGPDGSAYLVTDPSIQHPAHKFIVHKIDPDGHVVAGYGGTSKMVAWPGDGAPAPATDVTVAAVDSQDRLIVGTTANVGGDRRYYFIRFTADGAADTTFGTGGATTYPAVADSTAANELHALVVAPGDQIVATGASDGPGVGLRAATVRLTSGGVLDPTFAGGGAVFTSSHLSHGDGVAIQKGPGAGKVIIAGDGFSNEVVLTRYTAAGVPDTTFGSAGTGTVIDTNVGGSSKPVFIGGLATTPKGKLLVNGWIEYSANSDDAFTARYLLTDPGLSPEHQTPPTVRGPNPGDKAIPRVGAGLHCDAGTYTNSPTLTVEWQRALRNASDGDASAWHAVPNGSNRDYTIAEDDNGSRLRCMEHAINADGSDDVASESLRIDGGNPANIRKPTVAGIPIVGERLTCDTGEWTNGPDLSVNWTRDGHDINSSDSIGRIYTLNINDRRANVGCRVTAKNDIGPADAPADSETHLVVLNPPANQRKPVATSSVVGGKATDIQVTCGNPGTWDEDYHQYDYRWLREGADIAGAVGQTYHATTDDLGRNISCVSYSTNPKGRSQGAISAPVLVPLPTNGIPGKLYVSGGFNRLDPVNWLAVSKEYLDVIGQLAEEHRYAAVLAMIKSCKAGPNAGAQPPSSAAEYTQNTIIGGPKLCGIMINQFGYVYTAPEATYYMDYGLTCSVPGYIDNGKHKCPTLKVPIDPLNYDALSHLTAGEQARIASTKPLQVLWDFDNDGRTDATCDPDAPILRSLYNRGYYRPHAVIVNGNSGETGIYSVTDGNFGFFPESQSQKGSVRSGQPFACKTSLAPPPEENKPCINEVTVGRVHMTGNLCPISARRIPENELDGLPADVQKMLVDQALNGPLRRRSSAAFATPETGTLGGLPPSSRSTAGELNTQVSALATLDSAKVASIPTKWEDALKKQASFNLEQAQKAMDQIYISKGTSFLNGVKMDPVGNAATILVPSDAGDAIKSVKKMTVSSTNLATSLGGIPIGAAGKLTQDLKDQATAAAKDEAETVLRGANLDQIANNLKDKLNLGPFKLAGDAKVKLNNDGTATIDAYAELPQLLTKPGSSPIRVGVQVNATREGKLTLNGIHLTAPSAYLGGILISDLALDYDNNGLSIQGKLLFPPVNQGISINKFRLGSHGEFQELDVDYLAGAGQGINIGPGIFLTKIGGGLSLNPDEVRARAAVSVGPSSGGGCPTAGIDAGMTVHFAPSPFFVDVTGTVGLVCIPVGNVHFYADTTGLVSLGANVNLDIGPLYFHAALNGKLQLPRWQVDLRGDGGIKHVISATVKVLIGNLGLAGCGSIEVFPETPLTDAVHLSAGAGVHFSDGRPPLSFPELVANLDGFLGCNLSRWSPFGKDIRQAGTGRSFTVKKPAPKVLALQVTGKNAPPLVKLTAPDGKTIDASKLTENFSQGEGVSGLLDPTRSRAVLYLHGQAGQWQLAPVAGSPAIVDVQYAEPIPAPKITAKVGGAGAARRLKFNVVKLAGQTVTFVEQSAKGQRVIATVKGGGKGTKPFVTSEGGGKARKIIAQVAQDGIPRDNVTVAKFTAPSPRPGKARHLKVRRKGTKATATWAKSFYTKTYTVAIQTGDGHRFVLMPKRRKVTFGGLGKGEGATVSVTSVAASGAHGGTATARLKGAKHYSGFKNKKRPKVKHHKAKKKAVKKQG